MRIRLCLAAVLNAKPGAFSSLMAIVCGSWTTINMGTSGRHVVHPLGNDRNYVELANCMASRYLSFDMTVDIVGCHIFPSLRNGTHYIHQENTYMMMIMMTGCSLASPNPLAPPPPFPSSSILLACSSQASTSDHRCGDDGRLLVGGAAGK